MEHNEKCNCKNCPWNEECEVLQDNASRQELKTDQYRTSKT